IQDQFKINFRISRRSHNDFGFFKIRKSRIFLTPSSNPFSITCD
ncbi:hypothetical protein M153_19270002, partial [Pseudoloma neurophilia]